MHKSRRRGRESVQEVNHGSAVHCRHARWRLDPIGQFVSIGNSPPNGSVFGEHRDADGTHERIFQREIEISMMVFPVMARAKAVLAYGGKGMGFVGGKGFAHRLTLGLKDVNSQIAHPYIGSLTQPLADDYHDIETGQHVHRSACAMFTGTFSRKVDDFAAVGNDEVGGSLSEVRTDRAHQAVVFKNRKADVHGFDLKELSICS